MNVPVTALAGVFVLTAVRQVGSLKLQIWQIMLAGALVVLFTGGSFKAPSAGKEGRSRSSNSRG